MFIHSKDVFCLMRKRAAIYVTCPIELCIQRSGKEEKDGQQGMGRIYSSTMMSTNAYLKSDDIYSFNGKYLLSTYYVNAVNRQETKPVLAEFIPQQCLPEMCSPHIHVQDACQGVCCQRPHPHVSSWGTPCF